MSALQISIGLLIFLTMVIKPIIYKPCVQYFRPEFSATFTSLWLLLGLAISWPLLGHLLTDNWQKICFSPYLLFSILKGVLLYAMVKYQQEVNKYSTSSSVFFGFIATALGSLIINIFFKEGLSLLQMSCISALACWEEYFTHTGTPNAFLIKGKKDFY